jgi:hypothetical protein
MTAAVQTSALREQDIVNACLEVLRYKGVFAWRQNQGRLPVKDRSGARLVSFTSINGVSDIIGVLPDGRFLAVECKRPGNVPTGDQQDFLNAVRRRRGLALVITDAEDLAETLDRELTRGSR